MKKMIHVLSVLSLMFVTAACEAGPPRSDQVQAKAQEQMAMEATQQTGMPAIKNFFERKTMKMIMEMRDQSNLTTYTYLWNEMQGKKVFLCNSIGYGLPYATQYTNPQKIAEAGHSYGYAILPQADPNGLFMPGSADATWVLCKNPKGDEVKPLYVEPKIIVSPFPLDL